MEAPMSPIPLPALDVKTPSAENPMDAIMRIFQVRGLQNQTQLQGAQLESEQMKNQAQQLELQDDSKWRDALADPSWDGTPEQLLKNGLKRGVGPKSYYGMQTGLAQSQEAMAKLGSSQLSILNSVQDKIGDLIENVRDAKPEGKLAAQVEAKRDAESLINGTVGLNPHARQALMQHVSSIPDDQYVGDDVLNQMVGTMKLHSALTEESLKQAQTNEATQKGNQAAAAAANDRANLPKIQAEAAVAPQMAKLGVTAKRTEIAKNVAETAKAKAETENLGQLPVFAVDPTTNQRVMTTRPEAQAKGYTNVVPVKESDINKERDATAMTNDVQLNTSRYRTAVRQMYQEPMNGKQAIAITALLPEKLGIDIGHGIGLNLPDVIQKTANAAAFSVLSPTQKRAVIGYYSTLASVPAAQKALTNIGRSNKEMLDLELRTIPTPAMDGGTFDAMLDRFQGNIDQTAAKNVRIPGMPSTAEVRSENEPGWQPKQNKSQWPPTSMQPMSSLLSMIDSQ
jgi:hypothetical protein